MFYKKTGKPEVSDLVLCTVKKILYHSVFVTLDEYKGVEGMVHISEIAPGRIRNLRDYVKEGKRIVCKVLKIDERRGNIDLSLRRVGTGLRLKKVAEYKQEEKAEKLLELVGKGLNISLKDMYSKVGVEALKEYGSLYALFQAIVQDEEDLKQFSADASLKKKLIETVKEKIKPQEITLTATLNLVSVNEDGVEEIRKVLLSVEDDNSKILYLGAPKYSLEVRGGDVKSVDSELKEKCEKAVKAIQKKGGIGSYQKNG